ncbi:MAG: hypothetical protein Q4A52_03705 [Bacillota bacterium]|nr:hypothetical protein [Bacillota bacterium]
MQAITDMWNRLDPTMKTILPFIAIGLIVYIIFIVLYMKKQKNHIAKFKAENPDYATVLLKTKGIAASLSVHSVNGQAPLLFNQGMTVGFVVKPGTHVVESTYSTTRPGVMHKTVTKTYGPSKQEITVEAGKTYHYLFDPKQEMYEFTEQMPE